MHCRDVRRDHVASARRRLVVGAGASAADVLATWREVRRADDRAWIAVRSKLRAMPSSLLGIDVHYLVWPFEFLPGRPFGPKLSPKDAMFGTTIVKAIRRGEIARVKIVRYLADAVELTDGTTLAPDLVVFATGFRGDARQLGDLVDRDVAGWPIARRCESRRTRGVFVVGARFARSLASSFLRGIARDAVYVAHEIASR
jgi:putative flavoprotein involved in K+ transport